MIDLEIEMKQLGRKHPTNTHNKRSLIHTCHVCHRRRAVGRNHQVEQYKYTLTRTHTHTHAHTHTHTHTHAHYVIHPLTRTMFAIAKGFTDY